MILLWRLCIFSSGVIWWLAVPVKILCLWTCRGYGLILLRLPGTGIIIWILTCRWIIGRRKLQIYRNYIHLWRIWLQEWCLPVRKQPVVFTVPKGGWPIWWRIHGILLHRGSMLPGVLRIPEEPGCVSICGNITLLRRTELIWKKCIRYWKGLPGFSFLPW